jgi:L-ribulose-5-phosphate 4-epimerase
MVIKPSGVSYDDLTPESMVVCDLDGNAGRGRLSSPQATPPLARLRLPAHAGGRRRGAHPLQPTPDAWAARGEAIPCVLTAMADEFGGDIPVGPFALIGDDSIGQGIVETLAGSAPRPC